jgi:hypothetical protein
MGSGSDDRGLGTRDVIVLGEEPDEWLAMI